MLAHVGRIAGVMVGRDRRVLVVAVTLALAVLVGVVWAGVTVVGGLVRLVPASPTPCKPPWDESRLLAAFEVEPLMTPPRTTPAMVPGIGRFCQPIGVDRIQPLSYTELTYRYPASWMSLTQLRAIYDVMATAEGWQYAGNRSDSEIVALEYCRPVEGVATTLTIAVLRGDVTGGPTLATRSIVTVPAGVSCPFEAVWGPSYFPGHPWQFPGLNPP